MKILFLHPDLGIGGAERLVVDAAVAYKQKGHHVEFVTNHYSRNHCFEETKQFPINQVNYHIPRSIFGKCMALCAYIRMCILALWVCWNHQDADILFVDQISACLFILKLFSNSKIIFYCHYPDQLLTQRRSYFKAFYRYFLDTFEEWTTNLADVICVNSKFTESVVLKTFPKLKYRKIEVVYPSLNTRNFENAEKVVLGDIPKKTKFLFVSLNRFEFKKQVERVLFALDQISKKLSDQEMESIFFIIAGGFDPLNEENERNLNHLEELAQRLNIKTANLLFMKNPTDQQKIQLLRQASMLIYTPTGEHFGIVPIEAMYMKTGVIAMNSGGPKETIQDGVTGFLISEDPIEMAAKVMAVVKGEIDLIKMGNEAKRRVERLFAFDSFKETLHQLII